MKGIYNVIKRPLVTEKGAAQKAQSEQVTFEVHPDADKTAIKQAIEKLFKVKVENVQTMIVHGKVKRVGKSVGRKSNWKKAIIRLKEGQKIDAFEGV